MAVPRFLNNNRIVTSLTIGLLVGLAWLIVPACAKESNTTGTLFQDEPAAHALYNRMIETMRKANTLSYLSHYKWEAEGQTLGDCQYHVWLRKPNYFLVETESASEGKGGILIGDGENLWIHWPQGRPRFSSENPPDYEKTRLNTYMKEKTPLGKHSIGHKTGLLGAGMSMPVIDPSTFHGYTDSLQPYLDGVKSLGMEKVGSEDCDKIEVSIMKGQRSWYLSLSKRDHLPRKLKQIVRASYDIVTNEEWSSVTLNADIPNEKFVWKPPEGWREWRLPAPEERLLKPGAKAPDFDLASADGKRIRLSDFRGKIVWLNIWRAG